MVGEIRDEETAHIAIQSALTGHLVFTSVHANNVFDVMSRFMNMKVDPYSFVSALNGVLAQRLVRINCRSCAETYIPTDDELSDSGLNRNTVAHYQFVRGKGCGQCRGTGFSGRRAIAEILLLNDELRGLITNRAPIVAVKEAARLNGTRLLREAALDLVAQAPPHWKKLIVLPSWHNRLYIAISPERISLLKLGRGLRPALQGTLDEAIIPVEKQPAWQAALDRLSPNTRPT